MSSNMSINTAILNIQAMAARADAILDVQILSRLPVELWDAIQHWEALLPAPNPQRLQPTGNRDTDPSIPADGKCPFQKLPHDLRAIIMAAELPPKSTPIKPTCSSAPPKKDLTQKPKRSRASDLMLISKSFKDSVVLAVYQERTFEVHVHQDLYGGGIEFLDSGRQPLQYQEEVSDDRFARFTEKGDFGFRQLKKIHVKIYHSDEDPNITTVINGYYMMQALCRLLHRNAYGTRDRMTSIKISFLTGSTAISADSKIRSDNNYWDSDNQEPRVTCFHALTDVEVVLMPFAKLSKVHKVAILLPSGVRGDERSVKFKNDLITCMTSTSGEHSMPGFDILQRHMDNLRRACEEFLLWRKFGVKQATIIPDLSGDDLLEDDEFDDHQFDDDEVDGDEVDGDEDDDDEVDDDEDDDDGVDGDEDDDDEDDDDEVDDRQYSDAIE